VSDTRWTVDADMAGARLDKFLAAPDRLASRSRAAGALERGKVFVNDAPMSLRDAGRPLQDGDVVRHWEDRPGSSRAAVPSPGRVAGLDILFEDPFIVVLNKPPGLLSVPLERKAGAASVYHRLEDYYRPQGKRKPFVVHRIDRDTSGLVVFARDPRSQAELKAQFRRREPLREYWAVVHGEPAPPSGTWRDYLVWDERTLLQQATTPSDPRGVEAISVYRVLEPLRRTSLIEVRLETGKRNQIRIQAGLRGHTLIGERRYTFGAEADPVPFGRQALHAYRLAFTHPHDGRELRFEAPLPADVSELLVRLRALKH
jgi:23S rRNA pseudouridine1911/1915/1917 synthase